jgi:MFS transporter, ACS family, pantothenate transporter
MGRPEDALGPAAINSYSTDTELGRNNDFQESLTVKPIKTWKGYLWDTWELPSDQRRLLFKVDAFVLTFASIGYFLKNIDQTNVNNAFLSGTKEELSMYGNELVTSTLNPASVSHDESSIDTY